MSPVSIVALFCASAFAAALGGILGMASGIFIVPILTLIFSLDMHTAIGASLVSVIACSCGSAATFLRSRLTNVRLAIVLETATTAGAASGVLLSGLVPVPALFFVFAIALLVSAGQMLARRREAMLPPDAAAGDGRRLDSSFFDGALGLEVRYRVDRLPLGLSLMYGAGVLSSLLGIGSGVLKIPAMDTALRLPIKVSTATSNFMIGVTAAAAAGTYFLRGEISPAIVGPVALGSVLGARLGARGLMRIPSSKLRLLFVIVLVFLALQMMFLSFGIKLSPREP